MDSLWYNANEIQTPVMGALQGYLMWSEMEIARSQMEIARLCAERAHALQYYPTQVYQTTRPRYDPRLWDPSQTPSGYYPPQEVIPARPVRTYVEHGHHQRATHPYRRHTPLDNHPQVHSQPTPQDPPPKAPVAKVFFVDVSAVNLVEVMKSIQACTIGPPRIKDVGLRAQVVVRDQAEADRVAGLLHGFVSDSRITLAFASRNRRGVPEPPAGYASAIAEIKRITREREAQHPPPNQSTHPDSSSQIPSAIDTASPLPDGRTPTVSHQANHPSPDIGPAHVITQDPPAGHPVKPVSSSTRTSITAAVPPLPIPGLKSEGFDHTVQNTHSFPETSLQKKCRDLARDFAELRDIMDPSLLVDAEADEVKPLL